ncbi:MAG: efflux RND transporter periplasmic adaptor subunit [Pseudomonadota bacterium]
MSHRLDTAFFDRRSSGASPWTYLVLPPILAVVMGGLFCASQAQADATSEREPLPVLTTAYQVEPSYEREASYLGIVRAQRNTQLGFDLSGLVVDVAVAEGKRVAAGDVLATLDTSRLRNSRKVAEARLAQVEAELELADLQLKRQQTLRDTGAVSQENYDAARLRARALGAQLSAIDAELESIDIELDKSTLRAPYAGVIAAKRVSEGAVVAAGAPVLQLVESGSREAHIGVAAEDSRRLIPGQRYPLELAGREVQAQLRAVRPDLDPRTLTATAVFELPETTGALEGEPVSLMLAEQVDSVGGWLPMAALIEGERGVWNVLRVHASDGGEVAVREVVEVLEVRGEYVYVVGTLKDQERVIADGVHRVVPGVAVVSVPGSSLADNGAR